MNQSWVLVVGFEKISPYPTFGPYPRANVRAEFWPAYIEFLRAVTTAMGTGMHASLAIIRLPDGFDAHDYVTFTAQIFERMP